MTDFRRWLIACHGVVESVDSLTLLVLALSGSATMHAMSMQFRHKHKQDYSLAYAEQNCPESR